MNIYSTSYKLCSAFSFSRVLRHLKNRQLVNLLLALLLFNVHPLQAQTLSPTEELIERYADIQLNVAADKREPPMTALLHDAVSYRDANIDNPEAWITSARIRTGYMATQGMSSMLGLVKEVKAELEKAIALNATAQEGLAPAFLGMLYMSLPGWPISFGDSKKATALVEQAMSINAGSASNNYYYSQYLMFKKQYQSAQEHLLKAKALIKGDQAHAKSQQFLQKNIADALQQVAKKL